MLISHIVYAVCVVVFSLNCFVVVLFLFNSSRVDKKLIEFIIRYAYVRVCSKVLDR